MAGPPIPDPDQQRYWRQRERLEKIKFVMWMIFETLRDLGPGSSKWL